MPRLTYAPSVSSSAARAAISSRLSATSGLLALRAGTRAGVLTVILRRASSHGASLDPLLGRLLRGEGHDSVHEDAREVDGGRLELAGLVHLLNLGDGDPPRHGGQRVEVASALAEHQVAVPVALPR